MKRTKITTYIHDKYPKAGDSKTVKVKYWNDLIDDIDELLPTDGDIVVDTISEKTAGAGVDIEDVVISDGGVSLQSGVVEKTAKISLTSANLQAMYATPIEVVAALGTAYAIDFVSAVLVYDATATAYTSGGVITINYTGGAAVSTNLAATFLTGAGDKVWNMQKLNAAGGYTMPVNTGLVITNASGAFATGTGVCTLYITYKIYTTGL